MVSGVAPRAKVMCLKVQDDEGLLFASYIFAAYQYAMDMGAHLIVNSFSNTYWSVPQNPPGMSISAFIVIECRCGGLPRSQYYSPP